MLKLKSVINQPMRKSTKKMYVDFLLPFYKSNYFLSTFSRSHRWPLSGNQPFLSVCLSLYPWFFCRLIKRQGGIWVFEERDVYRVIMLEEWVAEFNRNSRVYSFFDASKIAVYRAKRDITTSLRFVKIIPVRNYYDLQWSEDLSNDRVMNN